MKKQVSFSRQLTEDQLPGSGRVNGANKKTRPMWGLGERSNSMNQSIFIRESPDLFRHSPASVLNQQRRHQLFVSRSAQNSSMASYSTSDERAPSQIRSASSNERAATPIPMQDFAFSILQQIESEKTRSRNGLITNMNLTSIDTNELKQSWDSIYHHNVPSRFRFLEATKPSSSQINTSNKSNSSFQFQSYENFRYETPTSSYLPKIKKQSHLKHRKKKLETTIEAKPVAQKPESTELKVEFPAVRVSFKLGDEEDEANENEEEKECEKLLKSLENRNRSVRLPLNEINTLKVNPREARTIRSYFFNPKSHSFTPMNTDEKFVKKYSSQK